MGYVRLCDHCEQRITCSTKYPILIRLEKPAHVRVFDVDSAELCSWDCVVMYAMRCGGVDKSNKGGTK